jgi:hypothetical protein
LCYRADVLVVQGNGHGVVYLTYKAYDGLDVSEQVENKYMDRIDPEKQETGAEKWQTADSRQPVVTHTHTHTHTYTHTHTHTH